MEREINNGFFFHRRLAHDSAHQVALRIMKQLEASPEKYGEVMPLLVSMIEDYVGEFHSMQRRLRPVAEMTREQSSENHAPPSPPTSLNELRTPPVVTLPPELAKICDRGCSCADQSRWDRQRPEMSEHELHRLAVIDMIAGESAIELLALLQLLCGENDIRILKEHIIEGIEQGLHEACGTTLGDLK